MKLLITISCFLGVTLASSIASPLAYSIPYLSNGYSYSSVVAQAPVSLGYSAIGAYPTVYSAVSSPALQTISTVPGQVVTQQQTYVVPSAQTTVTTSVSEEAAPAQAQAQEDVETAVPVTPATTPADTQPLPQQVAPASVIPQVLAQAQVVPVTTQTLVSQVPNQAANVVTARYAPQAYAVPTAAQYYQPQVYSQVATPVQTAQFVQSQYAPITAYSAVVPTLQVAAQPIIEKSQYHAQNTLGQAAYGHSEAFQTHNAVQDQAGNKAGSFSYVAPSGQVLSTNYVADSLGYRVASNALPVAPSALPQAPADTPEVVAARAAHLQEHAVARSRSLRSTPVLSSPPIIGTLPGRS